MTPFVQLSKTNYARGHDDEHFCEIVLNLDQQVRRKCCLKIFLIKSSGCHFCLGGVEPFVQFVRRHYKEHFCEIILNLDQRFMRCRLRIFLIQSSGGTFVQRSRTVVQFW